MARSNRILSFTIRAGVMTGLLCGVPGTGVAQTPRPTQAGPASPGTGAGVFAQEDPAPGRSVPLPQGTGAGIVAIVNGDVISEGDVANRRKLFALSSGLPASQDVLNRLTPRIISQLIDERLRLQEMQRRHIVVGDAEIAAAIKDVEQRNGMAPGTLQSRLAAAGVGPQTLIDQLRVQLGWGRVLRQQIGASFDVSDSDIAEQIAALKAQTGQTEFQVGEIFVPVEGPTAKDESRKFVDTIIQELRAGAPFAVAAAQFSQSLDRFAGRRPGMDLVVATGPGSGSCVADDAHRRRQQPDQSSWRLFDRDTSRQARDRARCCVRASRSSGVSSIFHAAGPTRTDRATEADARRGEIDFGVGA